MKVLIIGGNRFVGAELVSRAVLDGHEVTVVALDPPNIRARSHVRYVKANRTKPDELAAGLKGFDFDAVLDNIAFIPGNVEMLLDVLKGRIGRYVLTSTVDIYPRNIPCISVEQQALLSPSDVQNCPKGERYLRGKRGCEKVLIESNVPWSVIRPAIVFGRTDPVPPAPRHLHGINKKYGRSLFFPSRVVDGGPILLRQNDRRVFRLVSQHDVANALLLVAHHPDAAGKAFNVTGDEIWTSERLIHALAAAAGTIPNIVRVSDDELKSTGLDDYDSPYGRISWWSVADNRRLKSLGWSPTPASIQLTKLVESNPPPNKQPFYDRRLQEIALARRVLRQRRIRITKKKDTGPRRLVKNNISGDAKQSPRLQGRFSPEAAEAWKNNFSSIKFSSSTLHENHFRNFFNCPISSIGIGTHRGDASAETDALYHSSLISAVKGGINVIDTAINYRWMRAERTVGRALAEMSSHGFLRDALCLCSKGGFVPQDADDLRPLDHYIRDEFVAPGLISMKEAIKRHSIKAGFINKLLGMSLDNLSVNHIDVYYIHNPERALDWMKLDEFLNHLRNTFAVLEKAVVDGKIGVYGIATWQGFRTSPKNRRYLSLERIFSLAQEAGGSDHHFRAIQVPLNVSNQEALVRPNQEIEGNMMPVLKAASLLGLYAFTSASIYRGQDLDPKIIQYLSLLNGELDTIQAALSFARSAPGVGTSLVGLRRKTHVEKALAVAGYRMLSFKEVNAICE